MDVIPTIGPELRERFLSTLVMLGVLIGVRIVAVRVLRARLPDVTDRYRWRKSVDYLLIALGVLTIGRIWSSGVAQLGTFLGLVTAGLAIALREPITNVAGWLFLLWRRPFRVGDRIQIGDFAGDVVDIRFFQFSLLEIRGRFDADQPTGRIVHIPNATVFSTPQANASDAFPYIWAEFPVTLTFESNWAKAKAAFTEIAQRHGIASQALQATLRARYAVGVLNADPVVYTSVREDGVCLTLRVLCPVRGSRPMAEAIWEEILRRVAEWDDVDFAYRTTRLYDHRSEGKPGARAPLSPE